MATNPWVIFAIAGAAVFLVSVDATIAVAAFPALRGAFVEASPATLSWVLNAYTILYAALLAPAGRLVDLHGARRLFLVGLTLFVLASAACGLAPGTSTLITARAIQAVGGAMLTPASLTLILGAFPLHKRSMIVGLWSAAGALGAAVGPGAGATLIELASWRAAFLVNLPFGAVIMWVAMPRLPMRAGADAGQGPDLLGIAMIVTAVAALTFSVLLVEAAGLLSPTVAVPALSGVALLLVYTLWAMRHKAPAIDISLFADRTYALVTVASFIFGIAFSMMFLSSFLFLFGIWHFSQGLTGLAVTPGPLVVIAVAVASGPMVMRVGHRAVLVAGGLLYACAQVWVAWHVTDTSAYFTIWFPMQIAGGIAVGLLLVGLSGAAVAGLPPARFGVGGAVNNAVRQLGGVFGTALAVLLVGKASAGIEEFRIAFLCLGIIGFAMAVLCLPLSRQSGRVTLLRG